MGDGKGDAEGCGFLLLNSQFEIEGKWAESEKLSYNYDYWYQPYHNVMVIIASNDLKFNQKL